jgi:hypothetical protein
MDTNVPLVVGAILVVMTAALLVVAYEVLRVLQKPGEPPHDDATTDDASPGSRSA